MQTMRCWAGVCRASAWIAGMAPSRAGLGLGHHASIAIGQRTISTFDRCSVVSVKDAKMSCGYAPSTLLSCEDIGVE